MFSFILNVLLLEKDRNYPQLNIGTGDISDRICFKFLGWRLDFF